MITEEFPFDPALAGPPAGFVAFFVLVAVAVVGGILYTAVKGLSQWRANEAAPLRSVDALVVSRRTDVRTTSHGGATAAQIGGAAEGMGGATTQVGAHRSTSTTYYVTFEEESGERRELQVGGAEYGRLAEGDRGHLIHQGTRYKGFTRQGA